LTVPNLISLLRILIAPIFLFFFIGTDKKFVAISCVLFLIGALSDYFDGWYARKYKQDSKWGIFIDPLADKILTSAALVAFVIKDIITFCMIIIIIVRDLFITFLRLFADSHSMAIKTSQNAKIKTFAQFVLFGYAMSVYFFTNLDYLSQENLNMLIYNHYVWWGNFALTCFTVYTMIEYILHNKLVISKLFGTK